jgi:hypothetical protein
VNGEGVEAPLLASQRQGNTRSFNSVGASLRETLTALRMTEGRIFLC